MPRKEWMLATTELYWALDAIGLQKLRTMGSREYTMTRARALVARAQDDMQRPKG